MLALDADPGGVAGEGHVAEPVDVMKSIRSTLLLLEHTFEEEQIEVTTRFNEHPALVLADARALNQVFLNLIKNAAEAFAGMGGHIEVDVREEGSWVVVEVRDDGPGIPESILNRLFEPFVTTKETTRGSGLGLSISLRIVEDHDGSIEIQPREGPGTVARVALPRADSGRGQPIHR